jgi:hypothetical protein
MPDFLASLNPITSIISAASGIIDKFIPSAEDKAKAQLALAQLQADTTLEMAKLDAQNNATARDAIVAEAKSESWLTSNWRPLTMLLFDAILAYDLILAPVFGLRSVPMDVHLWQLLTMGLGGYQFSRSGEKMWADKMKASVEIAKATAGSPLPSSSASST